MAKTLITPSAIYSAIRGVNNGDDATSASVSDTFQDLADRNAALKDLFQIKPVVQTQYTNVADIYLVNGQVSPDFRAYNQKCLIYSRYFDSNNTNSKTVSNDWAKYDYYLINLDMNVTWNPDFLGNGISPSFNYNNPENGYPVKVTAFWGSNIWGPYDKLVLPNIKSFAPMSSDDSSWSTRLSWLVPQFDIFNNDMGVDITWGTYDQPWDNLTFKSYQNINVYGINKRTT